MSSPPDDPRARLDTRPMSARQWTAVAVCVLLNMLDGFDVLVMAFTADAVSGHWDLSGSQLGLLLFHCSVDVGVSVGWLQTTCPFSASQPYSPESLVPATPVQTSPPAATIGAVSGTGVSTDQRRLPVRLSRATRRGLSRT